jgi:predicted RNase H-like HicB family nuclease
LRGKFELCRRSREDSRLYFRSRYPMKYKVALHHSEEGYSVSVPGLPGCWSQGSTEEEALANVEDAIREYLEVAAELLRDSEVREGRLGSKCSRCITPR